MSDLKLVVITRRDLRPGDQGTQSIHVVSDYMIHYGNEDKTKFWKETSNSIIWLSCKDEEELKKLIIMFSNKYPTLLRIFEEPDLDYQMTAICFIADHDLRKKVSSLPLALKK